MNIDGAIRSRQNPSPEIPAEVEKGLGCIEAAFGKAWLERGDSPLQRLWQRTDMFATTQLHLLGQALVTMAPHGSWVRDQVGKIKRQEGERRGAMFELVGTSSVYVAPGSTVRPTPRNFQGYDAIVTFQDGGILDISMKNFGVSQHERGFLIAAKQSEKRWLEAMAKTGRNGLGLAAIANSPVTVADGLVCERNSRIWSEPNMLNLLRSVVLGPCACIPFPGKFTRSRPNPFLTNSWLTRPSILMSGKL